MIQQAYKYVSMTLWPCLTFFKLKIPNILKSSGWGLEKSELPWEHNFYSHRCVSCRTRYFREAYTGLPVVRVTENQKALNCVVLKYSIPVSEE